MEILGKIEDQKKYEKIVDNMSYLSENKKQRSEKAKKRGEKLKSALYSSEKTHSL